MAGSTSGGHGTAQCPTSGLSPSAVPQQGAAGSTIYRITFTNTTGNPCRIVGFPGVSLVDAAGHQLGAAAERDSSQGAGKPVVVAPRQSTSVDLKLTRAELIGGTCGLVPAAAMRIYAPDSTQYADVPVGAVNGCSADSVQLLSVRPVGVPLAG